MQFSVQEFVENFNEIADDTISAVARDDDFATVYMRGRFLANVERVPAGDWPGRWGLTMKYLDFHYYGDMMLRLIREAAPVIYFGRVNLLGAAYPNPSYQIDFEMGDLGEEKTVVLNPTTCEPVKGYEIMPAIGPMHVPVDEDASEWTACAFEGYKIWRDVQAFGEMMFWAPGHQIEAVQRA